MTELCGCCGSAIEDENLKDSYEEADLEKELWYCQSCVDSIPESTRISELFEKIKESLSEENAEEFEEMGDSMRAAFALKCMRSGAIEGGTVGHMSTLRTLVASGVEG